MIDNGIVGKFVVIRSNMAGVHVGWLVAREGDTVRLQNAHRVWRWSGANTLSELAQTGADDGPTRISVGVPDILVFGCDEIIVASEQAVENLTRPRWGA